MWKIGTKYQNTRKITHGKDPICEKIEVKDYASRKIRMEDGIFEKMQKVHSGRPCILEGYLKD